MDADKLEPGKTYFICGYHHPKYPIPYIQTFVFVRQESADKAEPKEKAVYLFQHPQKFYKEEVIGLKRDTEGYSEDEEDLREVMVNEDDLHIIQDFSGLLEWLNSLKKSDWADRVF